MNDTAARRVATLERALSTGRARLTAQRRAVIRVLAEAEDHPDAETIHERARRHDDSLSLATVYRALSELEARGGVQRLVFAGESGRYEVNDAPHHDHIVDVDTGEIVEFRSDAIERLQEEVARAHGFDLVDHRLDLYVRRTRTGNAESET